MRSSKAISLSWGSQSLPGLCQFCKNLYYLSKPRIVNLTLVAALAGIYIGNRGVFPQLSLLFWTLFTLALATAGACILNNVYDSDIDRLMRRTSRRPLASGEAAARPMLLLGLMLAVLPLPIMAMMVNPATALLTAAAVLGYVVLYTILAKRRTSWANQIGGLAGAMPPMIGAAAVTGGLSIEGGLLFALMAVWQQPHALSLALKYRQDYASAGVPVIPVAKGVIATKQRITIYSVLLLAVSVLPYFNGMAGILYLITAIALGGMFVYRSWCFLLSDKDCDIRLFLFTLLHLMVLCVTLIVDFNPG